MAKFSQMSSIVMMSRTQSIGRGDVVYIGCIVANGHSRGLSSDRLRRTGNQLKASPFPYGADRASRGEVGRRQGALRHLGISRRHVHGIGTAVHLGELFADNLVEHLGPGLGT